MDVKRAGVKWIGIGKVWNPPMRRCEVYGKIKINKNKEEGSICVWLNVDCGVKSKGKRHGAPRPGEI